jgi:RsiW-degrading membrane proteinase PrsW (M82 family)
MGASTAIAIATMAAANNRTHHHHYHSEDEGTQLLAIALAFIIPALLWIVFTSTRQFFKRDKYYDFFDENSFALLLLAVFGGFTLFIVLVSLIYTLIK